MNARTRTLLAIAMSTALMAPLAFAQKAKTEVKATAQWTQKPTGLPQEASRVMPLAQAATQKPSPNCRQDGNARRRCHRCRRTGKNARCGCRGRTRCTGSETSGPGRQGDRRHKPSTNNQGMPPTAQGAAHAAAHSSVVQRDVWARLDADADGRISTAKRMPTPRSMATSSQWMSTRWFRQRCRIPDLSKADTAQGATNAASHSSVVQRATWSRWTPMPRPHQCGEADADAGIDGSFSAIDSNNDGFITGASSAHMQRRPAALIA